MSYLLTQMFLYMLATFLLGLLLGWLIWRYSDQEDAGEAAELRARLDACGAENKRLKAELADAQKTAEAPATPTPVAAPAPAATEARRPEGLDGPRGGVADELQKIKGVGPQMEALVNRLGFYHFDQIAAWTPSEVAWVDENLEGFKGRVTRDDWIAQAKVLARG